MTNKFTLTEFAFFSDPKKRAIAALAIGVAAAAFTPILIKLAEEEISPSAVIFHRLWISSLILGLVKVIQILSNKFKCRQIESELHPVEPLTNQLSVLVIVIGAGIVFAALQITWAWSLTQTSIANSALLHSVAPIFVTVIGFLFLGQRFDSKFVVGMIVAVGGSVLLGLDDLLYGTSKIQGDIIALVSALLLALYLLFAKRCRDQLDTITIVFYWCLIGSLATLPILLGSPDRIFFTSWSEWRWVIGLGVTLVLGHGMLVYSLKVLPSAVAAVVMLIDPILTAIFAWAIFSETLDIHNLLAFPIILSGLYLSVDSEMVTPDQVPSGT